MPSVAPPLVKVTVPVGVVEPEAGLTVAVSVTDWPKTTVLFEEVTAVVVTPEPIGRTLTVETAVALLRVPSWTTTSIVRSPPVGDVDVSL